MIPRSTQCWTRNPKIICDSFSLSCILFIVPPELSWIRLLLFTSAPGLPHSLLNVLPISRLDLCKSLHNQTRGFVLKCRYDCITPWFVLNSIIASLVGSLWPVGPAGPVLYSPRTKKLLHYKGLTTHTHYRQTRTEYATETICGL